MADDVLRLGVGRQDKLVMKMHGALLSAGSEQRWPLAVSDKIKRAVFDVAKPGLVKAQRSLAGIPTVSVSVPHRYTHSPVSLARLEDWKNTMNLLHAALMRVTHELIAAR